MCAHDFTDGSVFALKGKEQIMFATFSSKLRSQTRRCSLERLMLRVPQNFALFYYVHAFDRSGVWSRETRFSPRSRYTRKGRVRPESSYLGLIHRSFLSTCTF